MPIVIAGEQFSGPYRSAALVEQRPGVFCLTCLEGGEYRALEAGEGARLRRAVGERLEERGEELRCGCAATLAIVVRYTDGLNAGQRRELARRLSETLGAPSPP
ncbi:MAG: hypothetical protein GF399_08020 [Candidatus Coatesbacteria bacterium]|nr:hypothetical protein [Candidatus Coatesbacteria bacterium]